MNLQPVTLRVGQKLLCCACGHWCATLADLDGAPFVAFYCAACAAKGAQ